MTFRNSILAGITLIREAIRSPNYVAGVSGWTINQDGTAEFADLVIRSSDGTNTTVTIANGVITIADGAGNVLIEISAGGYQLYNATGTLIAEILQYNSGYGGGGFWTRNFQFPEHIYSALIGGQLNFGTVDTAETEDVAFVAYTGGGASEEAGLQLSSGRVTSGWTAAKVEMYSSSMINPRPTTYVTGDLEVSGDVTSNSVQAGLESVTTIAGQWVEEAVVFPHAFTAVPVVTVTGNNNAPAAGGATSLYYAVTGVSTTGFTLRVFRSTAITMDIGWIAIDA